MLPHSDVEAASQACISFSFSSRLRRRRLLSFALLIITGSFIFVLYLGNRLLKFSFYTATTILSGPSTTRDQLILDIPAPCPDRPTPFSYPPDSTSSNLYLLFTPAKPAPADTVIQRIAAHDAISDECLEEWVGKGQWAGECLNLRVEEPRVDLVWTWVNGSDPLHRSAREAHPLSSNNPTRLASADTREKQFRQHDELRFSLRSAKAATKGWKQSTFHLVANSYALPSPPYEENGREEVRFGQVPQWLDLTKIDDAVELPKFVVHHDTNLFRPLPSSPNKSVSAAELAAWREASLPTFNSLAIESQLANLPPSKVSENTVFLMDDNYILLPISTGAFYSPIHGPVFHLQHDLLVNPPEERNPHQRPAGWTEWRGLETAASHLSSRFGFRPRPYLVHNARAIPLPLLHEASLAFSEAFSGTATSRFRGQDADRPESHTLWLATHFIIERHREALLWSWVIGKWGGRKGMISREEREKMWLELGGEAEDRDKTSKKKLIEVRWPKRDSRLRVKEDMEKAGLLEPGTTNYAFVSSDGYPYTYLPLRDVQQPLQNGWPNLAPSSPLACIIEQRKCFNHDVNDLEPAVEMLKRIMVDIPECGDCIISALITSSGSTGLSIFLPPATSFPSFDPPSSFTATPPHLPLTLSDLLTFTLPKNMNLHLFALRLIQRYSYVLGATPTHFFGITGAPNAQMQLAETNQSLASTVFLCINDDVASTDQAIVEMVDVVLGNWGRAKWPERLGIERREEAGYISNLSPPNACTVA